MSAAARAWRDEAPDDAFPLFRTGDRTLLGEAPKAGNGFEVECTACDRTVWIGGRELCRRWPEWLLRSQIEWARALRCQGCGSRRIAIWPSNDPGAAGFQLGPEDTAPVVWRRRLNAWIEGTGLDLDDLADRLAAMPIRAERRRAGL